jgi:hypothetical protein
MECRHGKTAEQLHYVPTDENRGLVMHECIGPYDRPTSPQREALAALVDRAWEVTDEDMLRIYREDTGVIGESTGHKQHREAWIEGYRAARKKS